MVTGTSSGCMGMAGCIECGLEFFIHDAFMRGMHIDDHQSLLVLGEDVDAGELRERKS